MIKIRKRIGFDLDNTLIDYSESVKVFCESRSLNPLESISDLKILLKASDSTGLNWRLAQGWLYAHGLQYAQLSEGAVSLLTYLESQHYSMFIISHKTFFSPTYCGKEPLRDLALNWIMKSELTNFFSQNKEVFFEDTRNSKIERIRDLKLDYFVDDLEEVFSHSKFPLNTSKILFRGNSKNSNISQRVQNMGELENLFRHGY